MEWIVWTLLGITLLAAMAAGLALSLHLLKPEWSERKRTLTAAGIAAFLPGAIAFGGFFSDAPSGDEFLLGFGALLVAQLLAFSTCALPPAFWATRKLSATGEDEHRALPYADEPQAIEG